MDIPIRDLINGVRYKFLTWSGTLIGTFMGFKTSKNPGINREGFGNRDGSLRIDNIENFDHRGSFFLTPDRIIMIRPAPPVAGGFRRSCRSRRSHKSRRSRRKRVKSNVFK